ncbi:MAG: ATP-binding cassette domain-containing protein [Clostridiales bacterium]|nr:ATP-binding cassette domain-containing protein [Clostridiales bacterium]
MAQINVANLTFGYEGSYDNIFENVSFQIDTNWKLGFTGRNGRGKTTFLNLLLGKYEYSGTITSPCAFEYFPFRVGDESRVSLDIAAEIYPDYYEWEIIREISLLEMDEETLYRPFCTLSNGERTKILLAALFLKENSFLLIDEPTNHLDAAGREVVGKYLRGKKGFILVSHDRAFLDGCIDHILSINKADIEVQRGNFSTWFLNKERQDNFELAENEKLKKEIKRLEKTAREKASWSDKAEGRKIGFDPKRTEKSIGRRPYEAAKSAKLMKRSKVIEARSQSAVEEKSKLLKNIETADTLKLFQPEYHTNRYVSLTDISIFYGDKAACKNVTFTIEKGDRVNLRGKNGAGKTSVIKLITGGSVTYTGDLHIGGGIANTGDFQNGGSVTYTGDLHIGSRLAVSLVTQNTDYLRGGLIEFISDNALDESLFKAVLRKLDFTREQFDKNLQDYSGGQKKKLLIAKSLCERAHLLVWDEPLNFIDVISRIQIENLILQYKPTILFVEHDSVFCEKIATKTVNL